MPYFVGQVLLLQLPIVLFFQQNIQVVNAASCADATWLPYGDSKCYKLLEQFLTWDEALENCRTQSSDPTGGVPAWLATIKSADEQDFVTFHIFNGSSQIENNIWIGARRFIHDLDDPNFLWVDGEELDYANWMDGSPTGDDKKDCVEAESGFGRDDSTRGKWKDVGCTKGNWALCEGLQSWTSSDVVGTILQLRKELQKTRDELGGQKQELIKINGELVAQNLELAAQKAELVAQNLELVKVNQEVQKQSDNPVPIGFIYVQLPNQPEPATIWPMVSWTEVTSSYAGLFFRAEGNGSAIFGMEQGDQSRRITSMEYYNCFMHDCIPIPQEVILPDVGWSEFGRVGYYSLEHDNYAEGLRFFTNDVETRPKNTAVRIWRRSS